MLGELYLFACEPDVPYAPQEPWRAEISEIHRSGKAAIATLSPRLEVAAGSLSGEHVGNFVFTTRYVGKTIDMAESDFVVVYLHPYRDGETPSLQSVDAAIPSTDMSPPVGYCVLANRDTAINTFKLRLEDE